MLQINFKSEHPLIEYLENNLQTQLPLRLHYAF